ncbi:MAG: hypothetical protein M3510_14290 [Actinomycetota bacterium]|nr:hypothetical protein [Actinomycetota bacterium]
MSAGEGPRTREEFRRFVFVHHPDRGGNPETFAAGVAAFRQHGSRPASPVVFYRKRTVLAQLLEQLRTLLRKPGAGDRASEKRARR